MKKLYFLILSILLIGCANTEQSVIKNDDELTSKIKVLFDKYVENDFDIGDYYSSDLVCKVNNVEFTGLDTFITGFKMHHDVLYKDINIEELYAHTCYLSNGDIWSNAWFTWKGTGQTTGTEYTNRAHFDYKWEDGKIVQLLAYYDEAIEKSEAAALAATQ